MRSIIFQDFGLFSIGDINLAPYPKEKKNTKEADAAPIPNIICSSPEYLLDAPPINKKVSTYTCGLRYVNANPAIIVAFKLLESPSLISIPIGSSADLTLIIPYVNKNNDAIMEIQIFISSISDMKAPTPKTPAPINNASETAQTKQEIKTCSFLKPCLKTKTF